MTDTKMTELIIKITSELAALNTNMKCTLDKLADHEKRLDDLEKGKGNSLKDIAIQWLLKGLVASVFVIGSLCGAGSILKSLFGL